MPRIRPPEPPRMTTKAQGVGFQMPARISNHCKFSPRLFPCIGNSEFKNLRFESLPAFLVSKFEFVSDFGFRISDFPA